MTKRVAAQLSSISCTALCLAKLLKQVQAYSGLREVHAYVTVSNIEFDRKS